MTEIQDNEDNDWKNEAELHMVDVCPLFTTAKYWYIDLVHYIQQGDLPEH